MLRGSFAAKAVVLPLQGNRHHGMAEKEREKEREREREREKERKREKQRERKAKRKIGRLRAWSTRFRSRY